MVGSRRVKILVAYSIPVFAAPTSSSLVDSFLPPACVDPPRIWHLARSALTRLDLLAIVRVPRAAKPMTGRWSVDSVLAMADSGP